MLPAGPFAPGPFHHPPRLKSLTRRVRAPWTDTSIATNLEPTAEQIAVFVTRFLRAYRRYPTLGSGRHKSLAGGPLRLARAAPRARRR